VSADSPPTTASPKLGSEEFGLTKQELATRIEQVEAAIGSCAAAAGFEYVPVPFDKVREAMLKDKSAPGLSDDEYVKQYGYGITTQPDKPARETGLGEQNIRIYKSLAAQDAAAYNRTLFGEDTGATFALTLESEDFSRTGGCTRKAVERFFTPAELDANYVNPGDARIEQDPRVVKATTKWSECVRQAGYHYANPDAIGRDLNDRLRAILDGADPRTIAGPAKDELSKLQGEERAIAKADQKCEEKHLQPVIDAVETEIYGAPQG